MAVRALLAAAAAASGRRPATNPASASASAASAASSSAASAFAHRGGTPSPAAAAAARLLGGGPRAIGGARDAGAGERRRTTTAPRRSFRRSAYLSASVSKGEDRAPTSDAAPRGVRPADEKKKKKKRRRGWRVNPDADGASAAGALAAEFDRMARAEGFDGATARFAEGATFDDGFEAGGPEDEDEFDDDLEIEPGELDLDDFEPAGGDGDDDYLDLDEDFHRDDGGGGNVETDARASRAASMADRIAAARKDTDLGRVSVDDGLDDFSREVTEDDLRRLGFRREVNPFGDDETPRKAAFKLISNATVCSACGADFQCRDEGKPGFLPADKFDMQVKLGKIEEMQRLQEKAEGYEWSAEDEIEWLIQSEGGTRGGAGDDPLANGEGGINIDALAEEMGLDLVALADRKVICQRCHKLQNFGEVDNALRPGWTEEPLLSQESFRDLLRPIRDKTAVVVALVDLFDFSGSVLPELDAIAGSNPVVLAANKVDLLPKKMGETRAENWVRRELEYMGVKSIANVGGAIRLVSSKTGFGLSRLLGKAQSLAQERECDVYVVGAANAGKSTLINYILEKNEEGKGGPKKKKRPGNATARKGAVTVSPLPGTTLKFIEVNLGGGIKLYDTPGLLVPGTLTQRLTPRELKMIVPKKQVEPVTFRVAAGKCVLVGGLARIEVMDGSKPFLFTFFVSNDIKLHPTDVTRADEFIEAHAGEILTPPLEPGPQRMEQLGELESHEVEIDGAGWKEAAADITLRGLGWVAVTGAGTAKVKISVPKGIGVSVRPPLMPFDIWEVASRYTGSRAIRKGGKTKSGKTRKGVGRR